LLHSKRNNLLMDDFVEAFNVEKISKEFFEQYKMLCFDIENNLISLRKKDKKIDNICHISGLTISFNWSGVDQAINFIF